MIGIRIYLVQDGRNVNTVIGVGQLTGWSKATGTAARRGDYLISGTGHCRPAGAVSDGSHRQSMGAKLRPEAPTVDPGNWRGSVGVDSGGRWSIQLFQHIRRCLRWRTNASVGKPANERDMACRPRGRARAEIFQR
jgi:hypothetical protein